jgi:hypothetical protein
MRNSKEPSRTTLVDLNWKSFNEAVDVGPLQLSAGYRSVRRLATVFCAITIAWSSAQVELRTLKLEVAGELDLNGAFLPLLLLAALIYSCARCAVEYGMQSVEVRRWGYAQADFRISLVLMQFALIALGSSGIERSPRAIGILLIAVSLCFVASLASIFVLMMIFTQVSVWRQRRAGRVRGIAAVVGEALFLATYISVLALTVVPIVLATAFHFHPGLQSVLIKPPTLAGSVVFCASALMLLFSFACHRWWSTKLFATPPRYVHEVTAEGEERMYGQNVPPPVWDWRAIPLVKPQPPRRVRVARSRGRML